MKGSITRTGLVLLIILIVAFSARLIAAYLIPDQASTLPDSIGYRLAAEQLFATGRMSSYIYMPLYPAIIGLVGAGPNQLLFDIIVSTISVWLIFHLAFVVFADVPAALMAAAAAALHPNFIFFSVVGLTETLFSALVIATFLCWYRGYFAGAAIFAVLAILTRPIFDFLAPVLVFYFAVAIHRIPFLRACKELAVYGLIYLALMSPWWIYNYQAYGSFVRLNLGGGPALFSGNNPMSQSANWDPDLDAHLKSFSEIADPVERDRAITRAAINYIKNYPIKFVDRAWKKFLRFWRIWPYASSYSGGFFIVASLLSMLPAIVFALYCFARANRAVLIRVSPLVIYVLYITAVHSVVPASIRYRLPVEPMVLIFAAAGFVSALDLFLHGRQILAWLNGGARRYLSRQSLGDENKE